MEGSANQRLDFGKMGYGCKHYRRRCLIRAPCCNEVFPCRHCHNDATNLFKNPSDRHELVRHEVKQVICAVCDTEQPAAGVCTNCGVRMGEYFLRNLQILRRRCNALTKEVFHCEECGICRVGGCENFFHCKRCGVERKCGRNTRVQSMLSRARCGIRYATRALDLAMGLVCATITCAWKTQCVTTVLFVMRYCCRICSKSVFDMSKAWKRIDYEVQSTIMPEDYRNKKVWILCNDCNDTTEVFFNIIGQKCTHCNSYNTRTISPPVLPS